ncbi:thymidine phosphorylase [Agrobacterium fabrum]|uniref:Thymidine phosphorylase n=1 Tax=Agrobacterium fabrum (strain C58 / ATCC 33970) TaxID=176299 RepID=TYPH_AGRFC|nr:thymidine phosphorylase [Agrobacterium fabrum]Q8UJ08.1 RecName: Full=Thymidine phosphorylase; AltName: Full=TdRPase [Agrobacterium fabrum str. C58]CAD0209808.1 Thymidine phosphorylase [Agrobacterium tumefaciens]AAK85954.1 thymidine phosphorylase [Agrobacterium fabrum str. C58]MCX2874762.1 thymidine phosphorylase [Agrobacterium fabrum]QQN05565.1 thymidine phosphorylase [Agrobacterium fabrum]QQN10628.1 thymidine phosphorylase [Agrobacterium fabrum]
MSLIPQEIIRRKRDGLSLAPQEIAAFIEALSKDGISEGQAAAFAMAVFFRGMNRDEMVALTLAMRDSGDVLSWRDIGRPVADKHSTGGVGDNVSLMLAPIVAACGLAVPMISGRGLGHTGGTLDKLEAIPGYDVMPDEALFRRTVQSVGCAIIGQTGDLAPADKRLYAIRDVTATVDSIPLITASILSKKLAAGLETLVLDVKVGNGAFMQSLEDARILARALVDVANGAGLPTTALITDMNQPLCDAAGNAVEIVNCLEFLAGGKAGTRLEKVVLSFAAEMLVQARKAATLEEGEALASAALSSGRAMEIFARMVSVLGGPSDFIENPSRYLACAPIILPVPAARSGWLASCATRDLGMVVVELGGGRTKPSDTINPAVGISDILPLGVRVEKGEPIAVVHAASSEDAERAVKRIEDCFGIADNAPEIAASVLERIT